MVTKRKRRAPDVCRVCREPIYDVTSAYWPVCTRCRRTVRGLPVVVIPYEETLAHGIDTVALCGVKMDWPVFLETKK